MTDAAPISWDYSAAGVLVKMNRMANDQFQGRICKIRWRSERFVPTRSTPGGETLTGRQSRFDPLPLIDRGLEKLTRRLLVIPPRLLLILPDPAPEQGDPTLRTPADAKPSRANGDSNGRFRRRQPR